MLSKIILHTTTKLLEKELKKQNVKWIIIVIKK